MRTVSQMLEDKMDEAVTHYINNHQTNEGVHIDPGPLSLNIHDDSGRQVVTVMHPQNFHHSSLARSISIGEVTEVGEAWNEDLLDADGKLAAIVAHLAQHNRPALLKVATLRGDLDPTVLTDGSIRLFNSHTLDEPLPMTSTSPLPPLQRCPPPHAQWLNEKTKSPSLIPDNDTSVLEVMSPTATKLQSKKSLPHKKRISRRLKRSNPTGSIQQPPERDDQELVVLDCPESAPQEEILPDNFAPTASLPDPGHHIPHEVRPIFICQICGDFYGEEQLKFYQHLKQHYEPHATIIIENPVPDLGIDKISNTCIVDNVSQLPDSLVELSLENTLPSSKPAVYQTIKEHILYTTSDRTLTYNGNKILYSMASSHKESVIADHQKDSILYEELTKSFHCNKCDAIFRKQKHCEAHMKEAHSKLDMDIAEFSEPEDLMEGIHVSVSEEGSADPRVSYHDALLPQLGGDRHEHVRHWYTRDGVESQCTGEGCPVCEHNSHPTHSTHGTHSPDTAVAAREPHQESPSQLKEEVYQRMFEVNHSDPPQFPGPFEQPAPGAPRLHPPTPDPEGAPPEDSEPESPQKFSGQILSQIGIVKKEPKESQFKCEACDRVFRHRNSLRYHVVSHSANRPHVCIECGKGFLTPMALKIHQRIHTGARPYACVDCDKTFRQCSDLKYHVSSIHSSKKQYKCEFCAKEFARKYSLNVHRTVHTGERKYLCDFCPKAFRASSYRLTHMRTHSGEKPYKCEICARAFRVKADLNRHMTVHAYTRVRVKMEISTDDADRSDPADPPDPPVHTDNTDHTVNTAQTKPTKKESKKKHKADASKVTQTKRRSKRTKNSETIDKKKDKSESEIEASKQLLKSKILSSNEYYSIRSNITSKGVESARGKRTDSATSGAVKHEPARPSEPAASEPTPSEPAVAENTFLERLTALYNISA